jgi:hypothetical protein
MERSQWPHRLRIQQGRTVRFQNAWFLSLCSVMSGDSLAKTRAAWSPEYTGFEVERLETRGVVLTPEDLSFSEWPHRAKEAGLTTIALHHWRDVTHVSSFVQKDEGAAFLAACGDLVSS